MYRYLINLHVLVHFTCLFLPPIQKNNKQQLKKKTHRPPLSDLGTVCVGPVTSDLVGFFSYGGMAILPSMTGIRLSLQ